jgi:hypothetical protein
MSRRLLAVSGLVVAGLSACMVVPIDPRTGQPYPVNAPAQVTVVAPPVAPATVPAPAVLTARLYPVNAQAGRSGLLTAVVIDQQGGRGSFSVSYGGDTLQGEATRVDGGYAAFGRLHQEVLGPSPTPRPFSGQRGIANGVGPRGVSVQCEYVLTAPGRGTGVCLFSDGAPYQMHFGG